MTIQERAAVAADAFERQTREDGSEYTGRKDDAPEWVADIIHAAHGDMLPDDWRYEVIEEAFSAIADADDPDETRADFADGADVYNADLLAWVGSNGARAGYVDDAREEFGEPRDFYHGLQMGQYAEREEVYQAVLDGLRSIEEQGND